MPVSQSPIGLRAWSGAPTAMSDAHLHADLELNLAPAGRSHYLMAGRPMVMAPGRLYAFWGAIPHQLTSVPGVRDFCWVTVGLGELLAWRLPDAFTAALFAGTVVSGTPNDDASDGALMARWARDWNRSPAWRAQCATEVAARLRRLALEWGDERQSHPPPGTAPILVRVARVVTARYLDDLDVRAIAEEVGVHPKYLAGAFRRAAGMGVHDYLTRMRLGHAQHLLRTTTRTVTAIALASGFGSLNAFYTAFRRHIGLAPEQWRAGAPSRFGL